MISPITRFQYHNAVYGSDWILTHEALLAIRLQRIRLVHFLTLLYIIQVQVPLHLLCFNLLPIRTKTLVEANKLFTRFLPLGR